MYAFTYHRATGLRHAANMMEKLEEPKLLAGGQTLLPTMKQRLASPANLIDLGQVDGMAEITQAGRSITIGAMARHNDVQQLESGAGGHSGTGLSGRTDRRSGRAPPRHDRRLGRQQRSKCRLSGRVSRARCHHRDQQAQDRRRRILQEPVRDRAGAQRDHHQDHVPDCRRRPATTSSAIRLRVSRWSACSSPSVRRRSVSP